MGHEISYETHVCGVYSQDLPRLVEENEEYQKSIENEIFALIMMDPSKVRNQHRKSKKGDGFDEDDTDWMNNAQYLTKLWEELKEQWQDSFARVCRYSDASYAVKNPYKEVDICPDCHCEIEWIREEVKHDKYTSYKEVYKCPKCGKKYNHRDDGYCEDGENLPQPMKVTVRTWSEG